MFWRRPKRTLDDAGRKVVERAVPGWRGMTPDERLRIMTDTERLVGSFRWEAAKGFELTDAMCAQVSALASLLIMELDADSYRKVSAVIVRPTSVRRKQVYESHVPGVVEESDMPLAGEAVDGHGPVVMAWDTVVVESRHPRRGQNVVLHEFAHKIDMLDGVIDGTPPMTDPELHERWVDVCTEAFERLRGDERDSGLRDYAATDAGEFFAVTTETFFTIPDHLAETEPNLYRVFADYYRQDPIRRLD